MPNKKLAGKFDGKMKEKKERKDTKKNPKKTAKDNKKRQNTGTLDEKKNKNKRIRKTQENLKKTKKKPELQDQCFWDMVAKTKKFNKAQVEFRLANRVER